MTSTADPTAMGAPRPEQSRAERSPAVKFLIMMAAAFMLSVPILSIYLVNYDRQSRSEEARRSIAEGWGGAQTVTGPTLIIPYRTQVEEQVEENGKTIKRTHLGTQNLVIEATKANLDTKLRPERRHRSLYEAIVYEGTNSGTAEFALPDDLAEREIPIDALIWTKAELRYGLSDVRGLQSDTVKASLGTSELKPLPGQNVGADGFFAKIDASALRTGNLSTRYSYVFRGNGALSLRPAGEDVTWTVSAPWGSPSFKGDFLPQTKHISDKLFDATWRIGGLSLGAAGDQAAGDQAIIREAAIASISESVSTSPSSNLEARVDLFEPVDIYSQVDRATKYGFLFVGFTFISLLLFDVIGGVRVSLVEYLLVGAGLVMFFVLLLALSEVVGFAWAYALASLAIIGLISAYSAAILKSWARSRAIGGLLVALYGTLYALLSMEDYALLIGSILLFAALATVMYLTRNVDWSRKQNAVAAT